MTGILGFGILIVMCSNAFLTAFAARFAPEEQMLWMELMALLAELFALLNPLEIALLTPLASREAAPTTAPVPEVIADAKPLVRACPPAFPTGSM